MLPSAEVRYIREDFDEYRIDTVMLASHFGLGIGLFGDGVSFAALAVRVSMPRNAIFQSAVDILDTSRLHYVVSSRLLLRNVALVGRSDVCATKGNVREKPNTTITMLYAEVVNKGPRFVIDSRIGAEIRKNSMRIIKHDTRLTDKQVEHKCWVVSYRCCSGEEYTTHEGMLWT